MNTLVAVMALAASASVSAQKAGPYTSEAQADMITSLPGGESLKNKAFGFSGYLAINGTAPGSKKLHYWLVESLSDPLNDPVAFWTNGGPGCSGLLGALTENGPYRPSADGLALEDNAYTWNSNVNMVFIEQPCGVGFSYSDYPDTDYSTGDEQAANDNYQLIQAFMTRFPQFAKSSLYLTSESYGGHYLPELAKVIVDQNTAAVNPLLNFKGFAVGNPATNHYSTTPAMFDTNWGHQLYPKPQWDEYQSTCVQAKIPSPQKCEDMFLALFAQTKDLNPYALDYPVCLSSSLAKTGRGQRAALFRHTMAATLSPKGQEIIGAMDDYVPCEDDYMTTYLNRADVKAALHVKSDIVWADCSRTIRYNQLDGAKDMTPTYKYLLDNNKYGLDILVYSGDDDSVCGTIGTQGWIWDLGYTYDKLHYWTTWKTDGQTSGYLTKFNNAKLAFATVHGAGHEVPTYKPAAALQMFQSYIKGELTN